MIFKYTIGFNSDDSNYIGTVPYEKLPEISALAREHFVDVVFIAHRNIKTHVDVYIIGSGKDRIAVRDSLWAEVEKRRKEG